VVVAPQHITRATAQNQVGNYVYFTIQQSGKLTNIKLVTPKL